MIPGYDVYIWMELLESLSNRIIDGKMDREETIRLGMDICRALILLRSKGIVHRNIKPQNILVNENGDYKLGDFGTARSINGTSTMMSMKGTFSYMSPEIMQGRSAGFSSDIYSLGLVMYRLMNRNRHPFIQEGDVNSSRSTEESNTRRFSGEALPMPVDADEELGRIILKACAYDPKDRWKTPEDMYNALAELNDRTVRRFVIIDNPPPGEESSPEPAPVPPPEPIPEPVRPVKMKKNKIAIAITAVVVLAVAVFAGVYLINGRKTIIRFGRYEQDNNSENGRETIEWIVLDVDEKNNKALLLSRYGLSNKPYNDTYTDVTWEKCTLRGWLNDKFLNSVFTEKEQAAILTTKVDNSASQGYWKTNGGNNTKDKIFLLSYVEASRYLGVISENANNTKARVAPTAYAMAQGAWISDSDKTEDGKPAGWWWLRSPGSIQSRAAVVGGDGLLNDLALDGGIVIRPALWIDLESDAF